METDFMQNRENELKEAIKNLILTLQDESEILYQLSSEREVMLTENELESLDKNMSALHKLSSKVAQINYDEN